MAKKQKESIKCDDCGKPAVNGPGPSPRCADCYAAMQREFDAIQQRPRPDLLSERLAALEARVAALENPPPPAKRSLYGM
jgi:hypothetical protein